MQMIFVCVSYYNASVLRNQHLPECALPFLRRAVQPTALENMKNNILTILTTWLVLLLHGVAAYALTQLKGHNRPRNPVHVVQAALLPVVEQPVAVQPTRTAEKKAVRKKKARPEPPAKKRRKKVRKKVVRKQLPPPESPIAPVQEPQPEPQPQLLASAAQHIPAAPVYLPPQQLLITATAVPQITAAAADNTKTEKTDASATESDAPSDTDSNEADNTQTTGTPPVVTASISQADYLSNPRPRYPLISRRLGEQGMVRLEVMVSAQGHAQRVRILKSSGYHRLDDAAESTVRQSWKFTPKRVNGQAVAQRVRFNMPFTLN